MEQLKKKIKYEYPKDREKRRDIRNSLDMSSINMDETSPKNKSELINTAVKDIMDTTSPVNAKARVNHKWERNPYKEYKIKNGSKGLQNFVTSNI